MSDKTRGYIALVGRPNVGKSTLFNRLTKTRSAIVHDLPGVTRDRHYGRLHLDRGPATLIDTGGFEPRSKDNMAALIRGQVEMALDEADLIVFVVDAVDGLNPIDQEVAIQIRRKKKPVILLANKVDSPEKFGLVNEFYELGLGEPLAISGSHGLGAQELLTLLDETLPLAEEIDQEAAADDDVIKVALIGRPNAGKSSLLNKLAGAERAVVSDQPGTTRDTVDILFQTEGRTFLFIDTAGLRRPGKVAKGVEKWSVMRALKAIDRADVAVVMIDAQDGLTDSEARIAGLAAEAGRAVVMAINKWDIIENRDQRLAEIQKQIDLKLKFLAFAPVVTLSALTGKRLPKLLSLIEELFEQYTIRAGTSELNRVLEQAVAHHEPPLIRRHRLKFFYATQPQTRPPKFVVFTNRPDEVHFSYQRYLINQFKTAFGLDQIPVKMVFRGRSGKDK